MDFLIGSESMQVCLYIYVLLLEIKLSREEGWDDINRVNPATIWCLPMAGPKFAASYMYIVFFFLCSVSSFKMLER